MFRLLFTAAARQFVASIAATLVVSLVALVATFADGHIASPRELFSLTAPLGGALAAFGLCAQFAREGGTYALYSLGCSNRKLHFIRLLVLIPFLATPTTKRIEQPAENITFSFDSQNLSFGEDAVLISWNGTDAQRSDFKDVFRDFPKPQSELRTKRDLLYMSPFWRFALQLAGRLLICAFGILILAKPQSTERSLAFICVFSALISSIGHFLA